MARRRLVLISLLLIAPLTVEAADPAELAKTLVSGESEDDRIKAGLTLGRTAPIELAEALDEMVRAKREGDAGVLATLAVRTRCRHVRLLFVWAASKFDGAAAAFIDKVDLDHPLETMRAAECLGFLRDPAAYDALLTLCRNEKESIAVQAARAMGRVGTKKQVKDLAGICLEIDNAHVRLHLAWAVQDMCGSRKSAMGAFAKYRAKKGTIGLRAKEAAAALEDELARPEPYKVKLDAVRKLFGKKLEVPPVSSSSSTDAERVRKVLAEMAAKAPDWYHLISSSVREIQIAGDQKVFEFERRVLKVQFSDMVRWDRDELVEYYLVRFATIMFLQQMGDPSQGHRGWEEGIAEGWWYAWDHTKIAVDEDFDVFLSEAIKKKPW